MRDALNNQGVNRTDLRFALDGSGELWITTKQDGFIRRLIGGTGADPDCAGCFFMDTVCDGVIDILDVQQVLNAFGTSVGDPGYNPALDIVDDGTINILDAQSVLNHFGETVPF